ncbi:HAMP domain-containing sensor histidine kinase [uncultured Varibaculum sp.]|uniref:sensor histidine kinase n=1 Tax=uncultured Varibaculum sp. TaxID=413896 RepID=UPI00288A21D4|nr:HAMP domain-containing sensor histidine kinase [uncultured Varibaculum sp.]
MTAAADGKAEQFSAENPAPKESKRHRTYWQRIPLTWRLVLIIMALLAGGLGGTGAAMLGILHSHLAAQIDSNLKATASRIKTNDLVDLLDKGTFQGNQPTNYFVRVNYAGQVAEATSSAAALDRGRPDPKALELAERSRNIEWEKPFTIAGESSSSWRAIMLPIRSDQNPKITGTLIVALPLQTVTQTVTATGINVLGTSLIIILIGGVLAYVLVQVSLRPLRQMEEVAGKIASGDLHERIDLSQVRAGEVLSLASALNFMLSRIEETIVTQKRNEQKVRQFVSDASHELRTPLAAIRGYGELYKMGGVPPERVEEVMGRIESEATRMGLLVEDLLKLARLDEGRQIKMGAVDLYRIAAAGALDLSALSPEREINLLHLDGSALELDEGESALVLADRDQLTQVMTNLIGNVERYTSPQVPVEILAGISAGTAILEVRDHGEGVPEEELDEIFGRFYRRDGSRSRETGGTGLGLSIVAAIAAVHGGTAQALPTAGGGLTIRIAFPALPPPEAQKKPAKKTGKVFKKGTGKKPSRNAEPDMPKNIEE